MSTRLGLQEACEALVTTLTAYPDGSLKNRVTIFDYTLLNKAVPILVVLKPERIASDLTSFGGVQYVRYLTMNIDIFIASSHAAPTHQRAFFLLLTWIDNIVGHIYANFNLGKAGNEIESAEVVSIRDMQMIPWAEISDAYATAAIELTVALPERD